MTPLHTAAGLSKTPVAVELLLDRGADVKAQDTDGEIPADYADDDNALEGTDVYWRLNDARYE